LDKTEKKLIYKYRKGEINSKGKSESEVRAELLKLLADTLITIIWVNKKGKRTEIETVRRDVITSK
jgi:hypothetical protein